MGFAWHKLIPTGRPCPEIPTCVEDEYLSGQICINVCPYGQNANGGIICLADCSFVGIDGTGCPEFAMVSQSGVFSNTECPREIRLSGGVLPCNVGNNRSNLVLSPNDPFQDNYGLVSNPADPGTWGAQFAYYYRTPSSPSSTPDQYKMVPLCIRYNTFTFHDRLMVISGRNRYKYAGWGVDPAYNTLASAAAVTGIPAFWHNTIVGATGLSQAECAAVAGREWPLPNSILNLPLWGANTSENPPGAVIDRCGRVLPCTDPNACFGCRDNSGVGHFLTTSNDAQMTNGKYYFSFQCFNPTAYYRDSGDQEWYNQTSGSVGRTHQIPTCSLWSLVRAIWDREVRCYISNGISVNEQDFRNNAGAFITPVFNAMVNADPSLTGVGSGTTAGQSMVRYWLDQFANQLATLGANFVPPNVFLWDKAAYEAASGSNKWKHLYVIGNGNILQDTGCYSTTEANFGADGYRGFVTLLDSVTHDPVDGSTGNARIIQFMGCNGLRSAAENKTSTAQFSVSMMGCIPYSGDKPSSDYCQECTNYDGSAGDCTYRWGAACPPSSTDNP